ncbi:MAG: hypothetical protein WCA46_06240, partial [Actinocatenispora sp.]
MVDTDRDASTALEFADASPEFRLLVVARPDAAEVVDELRRVLPTVGFELTDSVADADLELLVLSPRMRDALVAGTLVRPVRPVVVTVGGVDPEGLDKALREINWLPWDPHNVAASTGRLIGALRTDPSQWERVRRFRALAIAWQRGDRAPDLLLDDLDQVTELRGVLGTETSRLNLRDGVVPAFAAASLIRARGGRRRRVGARAVLAGAVVVALLVGIVTVPLIRSAGRANKQSLVTSNNPVIERDLPEWSAMLSAALLVNGSDEQKALARSTVVRDLAVPWSYGLVATNQGYSTEAVVPLARGRRTLVVLGTRRGGYQIGLYDRTSARMLWRIRLGTVAFQAGLSPDGRTVALAGPSQVVVVDLARRRVVRRVAVRT